jgi:hypothetical protein
MVDLMLNTKAPGKIDFFEFDVTLHESHEYTNIVTEFPVEQGYNISDHVLRTPEKLTLSGFVTNSPIPHSRGSLKVLLDRSDRVNTALESLLQLAGFDPAGKVSPEIANIRRVPQVVTVVTGLRSYSNMIITNVVMTRDKDTGESLSPVVEMRRIIVALSETVLIQNVSELNGRAPRAPKMAVKTLNKSLQTTTATSANQGSFLLKLANKLKGI